MSENTLNAALRRLVYGKDDCADFWDERVQMMQCWADRCDALRDAGAAPVSQHRVAAVSI